MKLSVVISSRNPDPLLFRKCLMSLEKQSNQNFELLVIDDGSSMPIQEVFSYDLEKLDYRVIRIAQSLGQGKALNLGIKQLKTDLIIRLDDDDNLSSGAVEAYRRMHQKGFNLICLTVRLFYGDKYLSRTPLHKDNSSVLHDLCKLRFPIAHSGIAFTPELFQKIDGYDVDTVGQDLSLFIRLFQEEQAAFITSEHLAYNLAIGSWSQQDSNSRRQAYLTALKHANFKYKKPYALRNDNIFKLHMFKKRISRLVLISLIYAVGQRDV
jgi:glycosyltransferase involved in cell wall biosynthesis